MSDAAREPSVKGILLEQAVTLLLDLEERGVIPRVEIEARLPGRDLELLYEKLVPVLWYPVDTFGRIVDLIWDVIGKRREAYMLTRGRAAAEHLLASGAYPQLTASRERWGKQRVHVMTGALDALFDFLSWDLIKVDRGYRIDISNADHLPECLRHGTVGFIEVIAGRATPDHRVRVRSFRLASARLVFEIERS